MRKEYIVTGISFPDPNLLKLAREKAKSQRRSLSNYVCRVLEADLASSQNEIASDRLNDARFISYSPPQIQPWVKKLRHFVIVTDASGHTLFINDAFQQVCGYSLDDLAGRKPGDVLQGRETDPRMKEKLHKAVHSGEPLSLGGLLNYHKSGSRYAVDLHMEPVRDERNRIHYFVAVERLHDSRIADSYDELKQIAARIREELKATVNASQSRSSETKRNGNPISNSKQPSSATELLDVAENTEPKSVPKRKPKP